MISRWQDLRFGIRVLLKNPGVTATAIITRPGARRESIRSSLCDTNEGDYRCLRCFKICVTAFARC